VLMRDFVPVAALNYSDLVMVVHPSVPADDLRPSSHWPGSGQDSSATEAPALERRITWRPSCSRK
jgi:hypothetical protein